MSFSKLLGENRNFRNLWIGQLVSEIGDWFNNIALVALIIELDGSGLAVAVYVLARHLPLFLFGPIAGVVSDRLSRRAIMIWSDVTRAGLALSFLLIKSHHELWIAYAGGAALMVLSAFFNAAKRASIPNIATGDQLLVANALSYSTTGFTIAVGSGLGGIVATQFGRGPVFVINSASFLFSLGMILLTHIPQPGLKLLAKIEGGLIAASWRDFNDGLNFIRGHALVRAMMLLTAGWSLGNGSARVVYAIFGAAFARAEHRVDDFGISVLYVAMGIGAIFGAYVVNHYLRLSRSITGRVVAAAILWDGVCLALFSQMRQLWLAGALLLLREIGFAIWRTAQQTSLMEETADELRGRVFATQETLSALLMMCSMVISGPLVDRVGQRAVALSAGLLVIATAVWWALKITIPGRTPVPVVASEGD